MKSSYLIKSQIKKMLKLGVVARVQIHNFRLLNQPITQFRSRASITELFKTMDAPTPENTNLQH